MNADHHHDISPLLGLRVGFLTIIPLDRMHLVRVGAMKKLDPVLNFPDAI